LSESLNSAYAKHGQRIKTNLAERNDIWDTMTTDPEYAAAEKALSLKNILHFFEFHAWTHEPRPAIREAYGITNPTIPFLLFPYQKDYVLEIKQLIEAGQDALTEKSRDEGVSWMLCTILVWFWLQPIGGNYFLVGSRKFEYVDKKGAQDTLFEKLRYNIYNLHPSMIPQGFSDKYDNVGFISNPETGSFIRGESNNANFATSGRYKAIFLDEFSKWEETDAEAWTSTGDSSPCRLPVSTPWGLGRKFADLRFSGAIKVFTLHWSTHPIKSVGLYTDENGKKRAPWYDAECLRRSDDPRTNIGQELDIDYLSSGTPYFNNEIVSNRYKELNGTNPELERYVIERAGESVKLVASDSGNMIIRKRRPDFDLYKEFRYLIAADVAEGLEKGDNSILYVYDRVEGEDVAWYAGKCDTDILALLMKTLALMYNDAWLAPESNNHGHAVIQKLKSLNVNIMYQTNFQEFVDKDSLRLGWNTNVQTRPIMCSDLREAMNEGKDGIFDIDAFNEMLTFVYNKNGKPEAAEGKLDDRVMTQAIKFKCHKWLPAPVLIDKIKLNASPDLDHGGWNPKNRVENERPTVRCV
jgi:hypothetical protein